MSGLRRLVLSDRFFFLSCRVLPTRQNLSESEFTLLAQVTGYREQEGNGEWPERGQITDSKFNNQPWALRSLPHELVWSQFLLQVIDDPFHDPIRRSIFGLLLDGPENVRGYDLLRV
jgi:hypothetical protein